MKKKEEKTSDHHSPVPATEQKVQASEKNKLHQKLSKFLLSRTRLIYSSIRRTSPTFVCKDYTAIRNGCYTHSKLLNHSCTHLHKATPKNAQIRPAYGTAGSRVKQKTVNLLMSQSLLWAKSSLRTSCTYMKNLHKLYLIISCICNKRLQMVNL